MRAALLVLALWAVAGPALAKPPVWIVHDADSEVVIFGSVHLLPKGLDWRPAALDQAVAAADDVWFELPQDPASQARIARLAAETGRLPPGQSLFRMLPRRDSARLVKAARSYGVDPLALDGLKPWLAEIALASAVYRKAGAAIEDGVEARIAATVPTARQRALETPEEQMAMFSGAPMTEQIATLKQTLKEMEEDPTAFLDLVRAWMAADTRRLDREAVAPLRRASPDLFRRLVTDRNARWAEILNARLKGSGRTVVVVGVGHMVGAGSLPERLRTLGYSVVGP